MSIANAEVKSLAYDEGVAARAMGVLIEKCPPFRLDYLALAWVMGWRARDRALLRARMLRVVDLARRNKKG